MKAARVVRDPGMASCTLHIPVPKRFNFPLTARSHGWCALPPFRYSAEEQILEYTFGLSGNVPAHAIIQPKGAALAARVLSTPPLLQAQRRELKGLIRTCLRLDEDFAAFHALGKRHPRLRWIHSQGAGRLLRAPTVFEDAVKILCTTNCTWRLTTIMVTKLTEVAGLAFDSDHHTFPTPEALAALSERELREHCSTGYRAPYLREFAQRVAGGQLHCESWRDRIRSWGDVEEEIQSVKGMGPYAVGNVLRLLGAYSSLALDSWVRGQYCRLFTRGRKVSDKTIERRYAEFGEWKGLIFWLDMTRSWHEGKFPDL